MLPKFLLGSPSIPKSIETVLPIRKPTWGLPSSDSDESAGQPSDSQAKIKATWLGHACFLVELPVRIQASSPTPSRGARILFDPVFSDRCSPSQHLGPKRYTKPPCQMEDIPDIDAIVISHNHYDHLDTTTIVNLSKRERPPHIFAPLGNAEYFRSIGIPGARVHTLDWWESRRVEVNLKAAAGTQNENNKTSDGASAILKFDVTCTPAQHFTGRGVLDRFKTLWASWVVEESSPAKVFFGGDTAYRTVHDGEDENTVPTCPAFKEIGARFGGFDLALIPIGAYLPRDFMSSIHCAPQDSVRIFKDIGAKRGLGMHWGTWVLTTEDVLEPPRKLKEECKKIGIEDGAFGVCDIGETKFF
ncbi:Metallo-hydrolase/oxidoreductase [Rickenella mellea]|uniref:Metallo-hydrolase/oxidoreductase n=1 Tax=Rickenella mellea TaxID=50990 RepID=A0A4Y7PV25_9AGAM|nr:Metallo-hydrolase/oxidoreductase [Rickenella mellea]